MRWAIGLTLGMFVSWGNSTHAEELPRMIVLTGEPKKDKDKPAPPPDFGAPPRDEIRPTFNPPMIGDFPGGSSPRVYRVTTTVPTQLQIFDFPSQTGTTTVTDTYVVQFPDLTRGAFKIAEGESPKPVDRFFINYNFYYRAPQPVTSASSSVSLSTTTPIVDPNFALSPTIPGVLTQAAFGRISVHRTVFGVEKTFLDDDASIEFRLPIFQLNQNPAVGLDPTRTAAFLPTSPSATLDFGTPTLGSLSNTADSSSLGDLSIVLKFALLNDRVTGDVFSVGTVITVPTGDDLPGPTGTLPHGTLLQPFLGFIRNYEGFFLHGFSSVVVSTDEREPTLLFNDLGLGWWLYDAPEAPLLRGIVPTVEAHVTTPLNHRTPGLITATDVVALTGGVHFLLGNRTTFTLGLGTPVTGPRPYELEASALFNVRY